MNRFLPLLLLVFVAASPHLMVHVTFSPTTIQGYEEVSAQQARTSSGDWLLQTLDAQNNVLAQARFDPYIRYVWGEEERIDELYISVPHSPRATSMHVLNEQGIIVAQRLIQATCGDGFCAAGQERTCPQDCAIRVDEQILQEGYEETLTAEQGLSGSQLALIVASGILILVLIVVLLVVNRKKKPLAQQPEF